MRSVSPNRSTHGTSWGVEFDDAVAERPVAVGGRPRGQDYPRLGDDLSRRQVDRRSRRSAQAVSSSSTSAAAMSSAADGGVA